MRLLAVLIVFLLWPGALAAQQTVVSTAVDTVQIAIYRAPNRGAGQPIDRRFPRGYALITETRTVDLPQGDAKLRFEGVSEGMLPESAIISGLPQGVIEKNRDARLLSPAGLVDAYLRRRVTVQRTNRATGAVREQQAILRTGSQGGIVIETDEGIEALRCTGLPERLLFDEVPADLSPRPTLSVLTTSERPVRATLTLTYLAEGFDWDANYIVEARAAGGSATTEASAIDSPQELSLFAWLTVANGGKQGFPDAQLLAVAGNPNKERAGVQPRSPPTRLRLECWPDDNTTSDLPLYSAASMAPPPPPPPPPPAAMAPARESIVVTGARMDSAVPVAAIQAAQEDLGDLKLYRVPEPITVAANAQKQVAMIVKPTVDYRSFYAGSFTAQDACCGDGTPRPLELTLRARNRSDSGLGIPLPQGQVAVYEPSDYGPLLVGQSDLGDKAVGQKVELALGNRPDVQMAASLPDPKRPRRFELTLTNALARAVDVEIAIPFELKRGKGVEKVDGVPTWKVRVPANGEQRLTFELKKPD
ncbi:DUF4139 domain-containing protein [Novosphingopyxis sp. YJ-S2-01]|uniref:DUF4139 domain-containing protein n=1 Tax=Novosphingopyxis sp. YJ-S2-01 TaxID=2794021 RepID=UPI0018DE8B81|nr:hypothetical protein [Novosphingopyxis sp. YJ-S2-01]MBH9537321.1 hypothetical protein [Novosphingopyxis sp. YJ-S2-01]